MPNTNLKKRKEKEENYPKYNWHILLTKITYEPRKKHDVFYKNSIFTLPQSVFRQKKKCFSK